MRKKEYLKILAKYPPCKEEVLGEKVWARKTVAGEMDMPMFGGRIKGSLVHIPIRRFLDWYCYVGQN